MTFEISWCKVDNLIPAQLKFAYYATEIMWVFEFYNASGPQTDHVTHYFDQASFTAHTGLLWKEESVVCVI